MAVDYAQMVYNPVFNVFARLVTIHPLVSQPGQISYTGRAVFDTRPMEVLTESNAILSDQVTILDIIEIEYLIRPRQGDRVTVTDAGDFEIIDASSNGTETTFTLRRIVEAKP